METKLICTEVCRPLGEEIKLEVGVLVVQSHVVRAAGGVSRMAMERARRVVRGMCGLLV